MVRVNDGVEFDALPDKLHQPSIDTRGQEILRLPVNIPVCCNGQPLYFSIYNSPIIPLRDPYHLCSSSGRSHNQTANVKSSPCRRMSVAASVRRIDKFG